MANTISADLLADIIADTTITVLSAKLAPLSAMSLEFAANPMAPLAQMQVKKATAGSTTITNGTNFESGDSTLTAVPVQVAQKTQPFHITNAQRNSGHKLADLAKVNLNAFANSIMDVVMTPLSTANFGAAVFTGVATDFDIEELRLLYAAAKDFDVKNLVLDGAYFSRFLPADLTSFKPENGAYGFDGFYMNNRFNAASNNIVGFVSQPSALCVGMGLPLVSNGKLSEMVNATSIEVPGLGITVQFNEWVNTSTRTEWASFDVLVGAAAGDTSALKVIASA